MYRGLKFIGVILAFAGLLVMLSVAGAADLDEARGIATPLLPLFIRFIGGAGVAFVGLCMAIYGTEAEHETNR